MSFLSIYKNRKKKPKKYPEKSKLNFEILGKQKCLRFSKLSEQRNRRERNWKTKFCRELARIFEKKIA